MACGRSLVHCLILRQSHDLKSKEKEMKILRLDNKRVFQLVKAIDFLEFAGGKGYHGCLSTPYHIVDLNLVSS